MAKFLYAYHGGGMAETEEEQAAVMAAWGAWMGGIGEAFVDPGNPVADASTVTADGSVTSGGGANPVTGYGLVEAADLAAAVEMAKGCPILDAGGSVEVCATIEM